MSKVTFAERSPGSSATKHGLRVMVDGKRVGTILPALGGFSYKPLTGSEGPTFPTVEVLKTTLKELL